MSFGTFKMALSVLTLIGSLMSFFGATFIALCYLILPMKRHFRHALILNLAISDGINALGNSLSGLYIIARQKDLSPGAACTINGLIGQITVSSTDFAILAISIVTLVTITKGSIFDDRQSSRTREALICASCWIIPLITGFTALGLHKYGPVSGNWCWIVPEPIYLRYILTHGWRFVFIVAEVTMYTYLHFWLRAHFKNMSKFSSNQNKNFTSTGVSDMSSGAHSHMASNYQVGRSARRVSISNIAPEEKFSASLEDKSSMKVTADEVQRVAYIDGPAGPASGNSSQTGISRADSVRVGVQTTLQTNISREPMPANAQQTVRTMISSRADDRSLEVENADKYKLPSNPFAHRRVEDNDDDSDDRREVEYGNHGISDGNNSIPLQAAPAANNNASAGKSAAPERKAKKQRKFSHGRIQKILLLNAYPAAYILLWIPGLANRIAEASGHPSKVLQIMQASTQFVGFANALTYGWNERILSALQQYFRKRDPRARA